MKKNAAWVLLMFIGFYIPVCAQHVTEDKAISEVISRLFKGMQLGDSAMVRSTFTNRPELVRVYRDKNQDPVLHQDARAIIDFLNAVGTPHTEVWHEEMWDLKIQVDGDFAQAWCQYAFYLNHDFSHCGVDSFDLFKSKEGWKIFHLTYTRRKTDCNIPDDIKVKHQ